MWIDVDEKGSQGRGHGAVDERNEERRVRGGSVWMNVDEKGSQGREQESDTQKPPGSPSGSLFDLSSCFAVRVRRVHHSPSVFVNALLPIHAQAVEMGTFPKVCESGDERAVRGLMRGWAWMRKVVTRKRCGGRTQQW